MVKIKKSKAIVLFATLMSLMSVTAKAAVFQDIAYTFDQEKNDAANDSFHFLRSYVDYFYLIINANKNKLRAFNSLSAISGYCVGDAHAENFGFLIQKDQTSFFTMNDVDDFGACPVAFDLYRFMASSRLYNSQINLSEILNSYNAGLTNDPFKMPQSVLKMIHDSQTNGSKVNPKKVLNNQIVRDPIMHEITTSDFQKIKSALEKTDLGLAPDYKILDGVSMRKIGGGSSGLLRYEILISSNDKRIQIELKEQIRPAIYPVAIGNFLDVSLRLKNAVSILQTNPFLLYNFAQIGNINMLIRPRFSGNIGVVLKNNSLADNLEILNYEAYTLGKIHSRSVKELNTYKKMIKSISTQDIESDVKMMTDIFIAKFNDIKK